MRNHVRFLPCRDAPRSGIRLQCACNRFQLTLETEIVKEKLKAYGLTSDEINANLQDLTGEQIHLLAQASDEVQAGGDSGLGVVIAILLIVLFVILILKLSGKSVAVR